MSCAAENPNRRLRLSALGDRVAISVDRASFDDLVTMVTSAPTWEKDRMQGIRILLRAIGEGKAEAPDDIGSRWTWKLARATRKLQDRRASADLPDAKRLLGALTNSRGHRHEENAARLVNVALEQPIHVGAALLASAEAYTPTAQRLIDGARERLGTIEEVAERAGRQPPAGEGAERQVPSPATPRRSARRKPRRRRRSPRPRDRATKAAREVERRPAARAQEEAAAGGTRRRQARELGLLAFLLVPASLVLAQEPRQLSGEGVARRQVDVVAERVATSSSSCTYASVSSSCATASLTWRS